MTGRVGCDSDGRDCVGGVVVNSLDLRKGIEMILLRVNQLLGRIGRCIAHPNTVLDQPLVDGLGGMCHEDSATKVGLGQYIGK